MHRQSPQEKIGLLDQGHKALIATGLNERSERRGGTLVGVLTREWWAALGRRLVALLGAHAR